jgi:hypothetical protein
MFNALCRPWICALETWLTMRLSSVLMDGNVDRRCYNAPTSSDDALLSPLLNPLEGSIM